MNRSFRSPESGKTGSRRVKDNRDEDLALFREMRRREKERNNLLVLQNSDDFNAQIGPLGSSPVFNIPSSTSAPARKTGPDDFLNSDNDKNDYEWLLTPPGTPLFPSLETEHHKAVTSQHGTPKARPTALTSRLSNSHTEPTSRSNISSSRQHPSSSHGLNTSSSSLRRPSSSGGSRPSTPTSRPTVTSTSTSTSNRSTISAQAKPSSNPSSKLTPTTNSRPSRSSTPTSRTTSSLSRSTIVPPTRSSTPTTRSTIRSSTPTRAPGPTGPASKPVSRASTPSRRPTNGTTTTIPTQKSQTLSSSSTRPVSKNPAPQRSSSPSARPKMWKPSEMPGFSLDAPPNLRTSINDRPPSATRGRPGPTSSRSSSVEPVLNGRARRQSCSPSRGRPPNGITRSSGSSVPVPASSRLHAKANDNVSPGLVGSKMVERTVNMRKLMPPKQDGKHSHSPHSLSGKPALSPDTSGFGRNLSKKSLDMAIRHMDIRRTIPGNLRPLMTNIPASSLYSVRSGPSNRRTLSVSDSPLATSSNASSELSVNNNAHYMDGNDVDDDISSDKGVRSPSSSRGR